MEQYFAWIIIYVNVPLKVDGVCKTEIFTLCMLRNSSGVVDCALSGCHQDAKDTSFTP